MLTWNAAMQSVINCHNINMIIIWFILTKRNIKLQTDVLQKYCRLCYLTRGEGVGVGVGVGVGWGGWGEGVDEGGGGGGGGGVVGRSHGAGTSSPSHWRQVGERAPRPVGWMVCFLLMAFVPVRGLCVDKCIRICVPLYELVLFLWCTSCVLLSDDNSLIPGCLWFVAFVLNNTLLLDIQCSTVPHLPVCFCSWTFFQNIGFNMVPSDPFMSHLATHFGYSAGEFQTL